MTSSWHLHDVDDVDDVHDMFMMLMMLVMLMMLMTCFVSKSEWITDVDTKWHDIVIERTCRDICSARATQ